MLLSQQSKEFLSNLFSYESGRLVWKDRPDSAFKSFLSAKQWRGKNLNKPAGAIDKSNNYTVITYGKKTTLAHRATWAFFHGPIDATTRIDHINGKKSDNRIENLRIATPSENSWNAMRSKRNASGIKGLYLSNKNCYIAEIRTKNSRRVKRFPATEKGKEDAQQWIVLNRLEMHKEFSNNGVHLAYA